MSLAVKALNERLETLGKFISQNKEGAEHSRKMLRNEETNIATAQAEIHELEGAIKALHEPKSGPSYGNTPIEVALDPMMWDALLNLIPSDCRFFPLVLKTKDKSCNVFELKTPANNRLWFTANRPYAGDPALNSGKYAFETFAKERAREQTVAAVDQQPATGASCNEAGPEDPRKNLGLLTPHRLMQDEYDKCQKSFEKCMSEASNYQSHIEGHRAQKSQYEDMATRFRDHMILIKKAMHTLGMEQ